MILRVGLTGGIASGKSTVARILGELGCYVIDADQIVRSLYRPGEAGHRAIVDAYGDAVLDGTGEIDRARLSRTALSTPEGAAKLNQLIHPLVIAEQQKALAALEAIGEDRVAVVEATLLIESGGRARFDKIVVVDVPPETQLQRAVRRGLSEDEARLRMGRQLSREERLAAADYVVDNSGSAEELRQRVAQLYATLNSDLQSLRRARS